MLKPESPKHRERYGDDLRDRRYLDPKTVLLEPTLFLSRNVKTLSYEGPFPPTCGKRKKRRIKLQEKNTWRTRDENREGGIKTDGTRKRPREKKRGEVELSLADQRLQEENNASRWCRFYDFSAGEKRKRGRKRKKEKSNPRSTSLRG